MPDPLPAARSAARLALLALALGCADASSQELYKLVDKNGRVTYSDTVPKDFKGRVIPLHIDPNLNSSEPSPAAGQDGEGRGETPAAGTHREKPVKDDAPIEAARRKAQAARKAFEDARDNSTPDDWVYVNPDRNPVGIRRFRKPEYEARLAELERLAVLAEQELDKLERERRIYP
ncbi:MAG TPA: DUF4124 domain-containing protein [Usitatibacteraceae bacterium]|nr:DUF4124 domain-containing protein [Usitatibacteraceae bacterium]